VEDMLSSNRKIVGMIVEPIQAEGGDNHASANFFRRLRQITRERNVSLIIDEVQTGGGATGKMWAHEHWNLDSPPDIVTFSKKLQAAGFFHNLQFRPNLGYRNFNTWLGDPMRALQMKVIVQQIKKLHLLDNVTHTGAYLLQLLKNVQARYPRMQNVRGLGTFCAFDLPDTVSRDKLIKLSRNSGVQIGGSGVRSIRIRPMLTFGPTQALQLAETLEKCVARLD